MLSATRTLVGSVGDHILVRFGDLPVPVARSDCQGTGICDCSALRDEQSNDNVSRWDWTIKPSSTPLALVIGTCGSWTRTSAVVLRGAETWRSGDDPCVGAGEKIRWAKMPHTVVMGSQGSLAYDRLSRDPCTIVKGTANLPSKTASQTTKNGGQ
jgi:hypothetical protein